MRKPFYLFMMCVMMICFVSCDSHKAEIKKNITMFAQALSSNDSNTVRSIYPLAAACDSIDFSVGDADITIEKGDSIGRYIAKVNDKELIIEVSGDSTMTFVDSRNVLLYSKKKRDFALATGWIEEGMSDAQVTQRFADKDFVSYLGSSVMKELNSNLQVLKGECTVGYFRLLEGDLKYVPLQFKVANNTPYDIAADDYIIEAVISYMRAAGVDDQKKEIKGEALKANSKTTIKYNLSPVHGEPGLFGDVVSSRIIIKLSEEEALQKYYTPQGNEYEVYQYTQSKK